MLTVRAQQHSFSIHKRMFSWKCQRFWDRNCLDQGLRQKICQPEGISNPQPSDSCRMLHLRYQGQTFVVPFLYWLWRYRCFFIKSKITFVILTVRRQQHSFSTDKRMFSWKCQHFWDRKCLGPRGNRTLNLWIRAECSLSSWVIRARILALAVKIYLK